MLQKGNELGRQWLLTLVCQVGVGANVSIGVLELAKRSVAFEGLGQLGDALSRVGADTILTDPAESILR